MGRKCNFDKFYTKPDIAQFCISAIQNIAQYKTIIEPSAGCGNFSNLIAGCIAMDIKPESSNIKEQDYFTFNFSDVDHPALVIGNPPFGRQNNLALKFIKYSAKYADAIAFILPKSFKKSSIQDKIPLDFHLEKSIDLPENSFIFNGTNADIPCVFQIWIRKNIQRKKSARLVPNGYRFVSKNLNPDFSLRRVGIYSGKASLDCNMSEESHYFIKLNNQKFLSEIIDNINSIPWKYDNTVGPRSISKQEFISEINQIMSSFS